MKGKLSLSRPSKQRSDTSFCSEREMQSDSLAHSGSSVTPDDGLKHSKGLQTLASQQKKHFSFTQHNNSFLKFLNEDRQRPSSFCDLDIVVNGKQYSAHKVVVAFGSRYFYGQLTANPETSHMTVDRVDDSAFQHLLRFLYTSEFVVSDGEIPSLVEAARFLDMIDAVRLLTAGEVSADPIEVQEPAVEPSCSDTPQSPAENIARVPGGSQCTLCSRTFCYRKSLENHLARGHCRDGRPEERRKDPESLNAASPPATRRSARKRKCPAKFDRGGGESAAGMPEKSIPGKTVAKEIPIPTEEEEEQEEEEKDEDEEEETPGQEEDVDRKSLLIGGDRLYEENSDEAEQHNDVDGDEHGAGAEGLEQSYPEGLAPVIIQSSSRKTLQCPKCDKTFDRAGKYESHTRVHTGEKPFQCDICNQCYSTKSNLTVHRKKHNSETPFQKKEHKCPFCNKLHASRKTLAKHVRRFHPDHIQEFLSIKKRKSEGWKCDICHKSFTRRPHLEEHMILHSQARPFKCAYCDDYFKSRFARLKHHEKYHLGPFPCDICGRQFNDTGNRKRHIECTHGGKRKWTCFICGKSVRERTTLKEHLRIHSGEKPHLCSICGQSFRHGSSYRLHLRVHHDDKRYECEECGKTFIRHDHLTKHKKIHSGEKAHQCEECGKCFRRHDHLTVHYRSVHLGEKVWQKYKAAVHQCEVCKKEFKGKSSLEMHFRTHSGEKPYRCHICNQTFRIKKTLTKHMVIHSDARPFNCPQCTATFKRKDKLKYHMDHVHTTRPGEDPASAPAHDKMVPVPISFDGKVYQSEPKTILQNVPADVCVPVTLVPVQMPEVSGQVELVRQATPLSSQPQGMISPQSQGPQGGEYQPATDLVFLEKYTLTPQPANIVHPVRPDQMLDPRDQSYLGTLLGLDTAAPVRNISDPDHAH
ncbi:zinc finger and BTB domain-containing protein 41 [Anguilla rostrata]|uniref:zinc finger and BTB domain-containing protein 41 n=1 Tax=Anguilla rostrata TaxID=7938 RepID=UPI0030CF0F90